MPKLTDRQKAALKAWATRRKRVAVGFYKDERDETRPITKTVGELNRKKVVLKPREFRGVEPRGRVRKVWEYGKGWTEVKERRNEVKTPGVFEKDGEIFIVKPPWL